VMLRPTDDVSLGFSYRAEAEMTYSGEANFNAPASLATRFPGGDGSAAIDNPATYFAGIAWKASDDFEVEFDYQGINWSSYDELTIHFDQNAQNNPELSQDDVTQAKNYEDTFIIRLGAEYSLPLLGLKLRAGWLYDKNPVPDEHLEPLLPDANRHGLNVGFGIDIWPGWTLDVAYMHMIIEERETTVTSQEGGMYFDGLYRGSVDLLGVNFTYVWN
jgi:long-chain fatty acid transport protein